MRSTVPVSDDITSTSLTGRCGKRLNPGLVGERRKSNVFSGPVITPENLMTVMMET
jgi:hypothetical protein